MTSYLLALYQSRFTYPSGDDLGNAKGSSRGHLVVVLVPEGLGGVGGANIMVGGVDGGLALKVVVGLVDRLRLALKVVGWWRVGEVCRQHC